MPLEYFLISHKCTTNLCNWHVEHIVKWNNICISSVHLSYMVMCFTPCITSNFETRTSCRIRSYRAEAKVDKLWYCCISLTLIIIIRSLIIWKSVPISTYCSHFSLLLLMLPHWCVFYLAKRRCNIFVLELFQIQMKISECLTFSLWHCHSVYSKHYLQMHPFWYKLICAAHTY